jgi:Leucine-rich repeat (LRR) protein
MTLLALGNGVLVGAAAAVVLGVAVVLYVLSLYREAKARVLAERAAVEEPDPNDPLFQTFERNRRENEARIAAEVAAIPEGDPFREWALRGGSPTWFDLRPDVQFVHLCDDAENPQKLRAVAFDDASQANHFRDLPNPRHPIGVDLSGRRLAPRDFQELASYPAVKALVVFNNGGFDDKCLKAVGGMAGLTHVALDGGDVTPAGVEHLAKLSILEMLRLSHFDWGQKPSLLDRMPDLRCLDLSGVPTDDLFAGLRRLTRLVGLRAESAYDVSRTGFRALETLSQLAHLKLSGSGLNESRAEFLATLTGLQTLDLSENKELTGPVLRHIATLVRLRKLDLGGTGLGSSGLTHLDPLRDLEKLNLDSSGVSDANLLGLPPLPKLTHLILSSLPNLSDRGFARAGEWTALRHLELTNTPVGDAGVAHLAGLPNLSYLRLQGTRVTAASFGALASLPNLAELSLACTNITDDEAGRFADRVPNCVIRHSYQRPA